MGAVTPGETLGTLYNIHVGSNKTKQHTVTEFTKMTRTLANVSQRNGGGRPALKRVK